MAINTYLKLQSDVLDTLNRTDLVATVTAYSPGSIEGAVQRGIRRAELRMQREIVFRELQTSSTFSIVASSASYSLPADYANLVFAYINSNPIQELQNKTISQLYTDSPSGAVATPDSLAIYGTTFVVRPIPDATYSLVFNYNKAIPDLETNSNNTILTNYYDVYLYASLLELTAHLSEDERIAVWKGFYDEARRIINQETTAAWTGSLMRANVSLNFVV